MGQRCREATSSHGQESLQVGIEKTVPPRSQAQPHSQASQRLEQSPGNGRTQHSSWTGFSPCPAEREVIDLLPSLRLSPVLPRLLLLLSDELARPLASASFLYLIDFVSSVYT